MILGLILLSSLLTGALWIRSRFGFVPTIPAGISGKTQAPSPPPRLREGCDEARNFQVLVSSRAHSRPTRNAAILTADEIAIYHAVLARWASDSQGSLNVANKTVPLGTASPSALSNCACVEGINVEDDSPAFRSYRRLTPDILPGNNMHLVDPEEQSASVRINDPGVTTSQGKAIDDAVQGAFEAGLFSLSEIAFDRGHHFAIVTYAFWCGGLCGNGSTMVFEKIGSEWTRTDRQCGGWVS